MTSTRSFTRIRTGKFSGKPEASSDCFYALNFSRNKYEVEKMENSG